MKLSNSKSGFTLSEAMIAGAISVVVVGLAMNYFIEELDVWREQMVTSELNINLEASMETFRRDLRLSSVGTDLMSFYPADSNVYTAISFPLAVDDDNDDMLERDDDNNVIWDQTVIYHIRRGTPDELIRTVFDNRNTNATTAQFYAQLEDVVESDDFSEIQAAAMAGETASSATIFENLVDMAITPPDVVYDGYNPNLSHYGSFNFGSVVLGNGIHEVTLTCEDKHASSSGYKVGIDFLRMSHSMSRREGELFAVNNKRPVSPYFQHAVNGGTVEAEAMFNYSPDWSEGAQLTWTPSGPGDTLTLYIKNDLWNDTTFTAPVPQEYDGTVNTWEDRFATNSSDIGLEERVIQPDSGTAFDAEASSDSVSYLQLTNSYYAWVWDTNTLSSVPGYYTTNWWAPYIATNGEMFYASVTVIGNGGTNQNSVIQRDGIWSRFSWSAGPNGYWIYSPWVTSYSNNWNWVGNASLRFDDGTSNWKWVPPDSTVWSDWTTNFPVHSDGRLYVSYYAAKHHYSPWGWGYSTNWSNGTNAMPYFDRPDGYMLTSLQRDPTWVGPWTYLNGSAGFSGVEVRPASNTYFLSGVFDTQHASSDYRVLTWTHYEPLVGNPPDGDIDIRVRSSPNSDMSGASPWHLNGYHQTMTPNNISGLADNRYVQYESRFITANDHTNLAQLRDVTIEWDVASEALVDLRIDFAQGPDYGTVSATVNSQEFVKAVNIDMTIYKETARWGRKSVSGSLEIKPLNTDR